MAGADVGFNFHKIVEPAAARGVCAELKQLGLRCVAVQADSSDAGKLAARSTASPASLAGSTFSSAAPRADLQADRRLHAEGFRGDVAPICAPPSSAPRPRWRSPEGGRIIVISSNIADYAALPTTAFYAMVKAGLDGLCKGMARDLGPRGITVNSASRADRHRCQSRERAIQRRPETLGGDAALRQAAGCRCVGGLPRQSAGWLRQWDGPPCRQRLHRLSGASAGRQVMMKREDAVRSTW